MKKFEISYQYANTQMLGTLFLPENKIKNPVVMLAPAWKGKDAFCLEKAQEITDTLGYATFAVDIYGEAKQVSTDKEAAELMLPLFQNRKEVRGRLNAAFQTVSEHPEIDKERIGAIGFCFGGLAVIELFKSGVPIRGVVSFHGLLGNTLGSVKAQPEPVAKNIKGSILVLTGDQDPSVPNDDLLNFRNQMTEANVDWEIDIYGHAVHAFTNPEMHDPSSGKAFDPKANKRSFEKMALFFKELNF